MTHYKIEGYILAGVIFTLCLLTSLKAGAQPVPDDPIPKISFYLKNDLDRAILLKIGKGTVAMDIGITKKFNRPVNSIIYLIKQNLMAFRPEAGEKILVITEDIKGTKILLSKIIKD